MQTKFLFSVIAILLVLVSEDLEIAYSLEFGTYKLLGEEKTDDLMLPTDLELLSDLNRKKLTFLNSLMSSELLELI